MANSEDIEARLCAFIEGSLSPAEQAEIERHLEAHPQHRQMIQDLIHTRGLVGGLPRISAPEDLCDSLQGQLERSMLLGGGLTPAHAREGLHTQPRRLSHLAIVGVVCLLSVGFSSVVYYLLHAAAHPAELAVSTVPPPSSAPAVDSINVAAPPVPSASDASANAASDSTNIANASVAIATTHPSIVAPATQPTPADPLALLALSAPTTQPIAFDTTQPTTQPALAGSDPSAAPDVLSSPLGMPATLPSLLDANSSLAAPLELPAQLFVSPATQPGGAPAIVFPTTAPVSGAPVSEVPVSGAPVSGAPVADNADGQ